MPTEFSLTHDPVEMIAGTDNKTTSIYKESYDAFYEKGQNAISPMQHKFIEKITKDVASIVPRLGSDNSDISASAGNIEKYKNYNTIVETIQILTQCHIHIKDLSAVQQIFDALKKHRSAYTQAYTQKQQIVQLEYESATYMLLEGITNILANDIEMTTDKNGSITISAKNGPFKPKGIISKSLRDLSRSLTSFSHGKYLEDLLNVKDLTDRPVSEAVGEGGIILGTVADFTRLIIDISKGLINTTPKVINLVKRFITEFPVIRTVIYAWYKGKANRLTKIQQMKKFIEFNSERVKQNKGLTPEERKAVLAKNKALLDRYNKQAEKLRAQLAISEKETAVAIKKDNGSIKSDNSDDMDLA